MESDWLENGIPGRPTEVIRHDVSRDISKPLPVDFRVEDYKPFTGKPTGILVDNEKIDLGNRILTCLHTPGHSPGHFCIYEEERGYLYIGDLIMKKAIEDDRIRAVAMDGSRANKNAVHD